MADKKDKKQLPAKMGRPRRFKTEEEFQQAFRDYILHCAEDKLQPNIAGFCVWVDITKDTFYSQERYFPDSYKKVRSALEDTLVNYHRFTGLSNPAMAIVQGKNTFKWDDTGKGGGDSLHIDVDFDADSDEIDNLMSKLGYLPVGE